MPEASSLGYTFNNNNINEVFLVFAHNVGYNLTLHIPKASKGIVLMNSAYVNNQSSAYCLASMYDSGINNISNYSIFQGNNNNTGIMYVYYR